MIPQELKELDKILEPQLAMELVRFTLSQEGWRISRVVSSDDGGPYVLGMRFQEQEMTFGLFEFSTAEDFMRNPHATSTALNDPNFFFDAAATLGLEERIMRGEKYSIRFCKIVPEEYESRIKLLEFFDYHPQLVDTMLLVDPLGIISPIRPTEPRTISLSTLH